MGPELDDELAGTAGGGVQPVAMLLGRLTALITCEISKAGEETY